MFLANFWTIFPIFGAKNFFLENLALSSTTSYEFLAPCQKLKETNDTIPRKRLDKRTEGRKDGRTDRPYFIGPILGIIQTKMEVGNRFWVSNLGLSTKYDLSYFLERKNYS